MAYPDPVARRLAEIRKGRKHKVYIRRIKGKYYVYEVASVQDVATGRKKRLAFYLGKIDGGGGFIKARYRKRPETRSDSLEEWIKARRSDSEQGPIGPLIHPDSTDLKILTKISTDGRATISEIAGHAGISRSSASNRLDKLVSAYGIKYTLEFGYSFFGFFRYAAFVKFVGDSKPDIDKVTAVLESEPTIQYAALLKGDYDLFIYIFAENTHSLEYKIYELRSGELLAPYKMEWDVSYIMSSYGYVPVRPKFFEKLEGKIWHKSKETPRKGEEQLLKREYVVLKELNESGNISFSEIDKKHGFSPGAAHYTYQRLVERGIIYRITITMDKLPFTYLVLSQCRQLDIKAFNASRDAYLLDVIMETNTPVNKYALVGDTGSPYGLLYMTPVFKGEGLSDVEKGLKAAVKGSEADSHIVIKNLVGSLGFRKLDNTQSSQYQILPLYQKGMTTAHVLSPT